MGIVKNARVFVDGYDMSGDLNQAAIDAGAEEQDDTRFNDTTRAVASGGLKTFAWSVGGFWKAGSTGPDAIAYGRLGSTAVTTLSPSTAGAGSVAYLWQGRPANYELGGSIGDNHSFSLSGAVGDEAVRGQILARVATASTTANGTAVNLGSRTAAQKLYAALHVYGVTGSTNTLTVKIQSDASTSFASPTTHVTFTAVSAGVTGEWKTATGASTDAYYRAVRTVAGATADFDYAVSAGIA